MVYILVAIISVGCWFVCLGIAKLIDLLNNKQDWYKALPEESDD